MGRHKATSRSKFRTLNEWPTIRPERSAVTRETCTAFRFEWRLPFRHPLVIIIDQNATPEAGSAPKRW